MQASTKKFKTWYTENCRCCDAIASFCVLADRSSSLDRPWKPDQDEKSHLPKITITVDGRDMRSKPAGQKKFQISASKLDIRNSQFLQHAPLVVVAPPSLCCDTLRARKTERRRGGTGERREDTGNIPMAIMVIPRRASAIADAPMHWGPSALVILCRPGKSVKCREGEKKGK